MALFRFTGLLSWPWDLHHLGSGFGNLFLIRSGEMQYYMGEATYLYAMMMLGAVFSVHLVFCNNISGPSLVLHVSSLLRVVDPANLPDGVEWDWEWGLAAVQRLVVAARPDDS